MPTTKLVTQRFKSDCVLASLSMATKLPYEYLKNRFFRDHDFNKDGVTSKKETCIMKDLGYKVQRTKTYKEGYKSILTVKSLNQPYNHAVYFDGYNIYDPNRGKEGKRYYIDIDKKDVINALQYWKCKKLRR